MPGKSDRIIGNLMYEVETVLKEGLRDDSIARIETLADEVEQLHAAGDLPPAQLERMRNNMMRLEGFLLGIRSRGE